MTYLTLELIKQHLNMNSDYTLEDTYLTMLGGAVEVVVERHIDDKLATLAELNDGELPLPLIEACLLLLGTYYSNRENIAFASSSEVGCSYTYLLDLYKNYAGTQNEERIMLAELKAQVDELMAYKVYDEGRTTEGDGQIDVVTSGQTTSLTLDEVDGGEY